MRRHITIFAVVMAIAIAAPVMAAPSISLGGSLETKFKMVPSDPVTSGISATSDLNLKLSTEIAGGRQVRAYLGFKTLEEAPLEGSESMDDNNLTPRDIALPTALTLDKAYLETTGAFLEGGQEVTTRFGDLDVDYSPFIAHTSSTDGVIEGVQMSGMRLGPAELAGFYGWASRGEGDPKPRVTDCGVYAAGEIEGIGLEGAALKTGEDTALVGSARFAPVEGMDIVGAAAWDGRNQASAIKLEAGIGAIPMLPEASAKAAFRSFDPKFDPIYRDDSKDDDDNDINVVDLNAGKRGVGGEVTTAIMGVGLTGKADWHEQRDANRTLVGTRTMAGAKATTEYEGFDIEADLETRWSTVNGQYDILDRTGEGGDPERETILGLGVGREIPVGPVSVKARYDLTMSTIKPSEHEVSASSTVDLPMLPGVDLSGNLKWADGATTYLGQAKYAAPNGIEFVASYDRGYSDDIDEGFSVTAGMKVEF